MSHTYYYRYPVPFEFAPGKSTLVLGSILLELPLGYPHSPWVKPLLFVTRLERVGKVFTYRVCGYPPGEQEPLR